mmetsp:Transcript_26628/g.56059  ORF Transcript_26628/g.56059 Transcript_26628/m.56059 type:complete len:106 (+) Transcript_26628:660-977(+)
MKYAAQCGRTVLTAVIDLKRAQGGWPTGKACALFENLQKRYNPINAILRAEKEKELDEITPSGGEDPIVLRGKINTSTVGYSDQPNLMSNYFMMILMCKVDNKCC